MKIPNLRLSGLALAAAGLTLQLASCVSTEREAGVSKADPRAVYTPPTAAQRTRTGSRTVLNTVRAFHVFSDPAREDNFVLQLRGPQVLTAQAHLIVTSSSGDTLRHEVLPARALLSKGAGVDAGSSSVRDQEIAILQGMNNFFAPVHFSQPAVPSGTEQPAEVDTKVWTAMRDDPTTVAFDYIGAGGAEKRLAYVRKLGRAVVISQ